MRQQNKYLCMLKWAFVSILIALVVIGLPITEANSEPKHKPSPHPLPDNYAAALHKALLFFDAQKCTFPLYYINLLIISLFINFYY